jgi:hypothetical protein
LRAALVAVALLTGWWLLAGLRAEQLEAEATRLAFSGNPAAAPRIRAALTEAADRTRSTRPQLRLAQYEAGAGHPERAPALLEPIVRAEPANAEAWRLLARTASPPRAAEARARLAALGG